MVAKKETKPKPSAQSGSIWFPPFALIFFLFVAFCFYVLIDELQQTKIPRTPTNVQSEPRPYPVDPRSWLLAAMFFDLFDNATALDQTLQLAENWTNRQHPLHTKVELMLKIHWNKDEGLYISSILNFGYYIAIDEPPFTTFVTEQLSSGALVVVSPDGPFTMSDPEQGRPFDWYNTGCSRRRTSFGSQVILDRVEESHKWPYASFTQYAKDNALLRLNIHFKKRKLIGNDTALVLAPPKNWSLRLDLEESQQHVVSVSLELRIERNAWQMCPLPQVPQLDEIDVCRKPNNYISGARPCERSHNENVGWIEFSF